MQFLRQKYKQKPQAWGPVSEVQASIFHNAESIGIEPSSIALAMLMWGPGNQLDYSKNNRQINSYGSTFSNNVLNFNGVSDYLTCGNITISSNFTVLAIAKSDHAPGDISYNGIVHKQENYAILWDHMLNPAFRGALQVKSTSGIWFTASFGPLVANKKYVLVGTHNSIGKIKTYTDAQLVSDVSFTGSVQTNAYPTTIAKHASYSGYLSCSVDLVFIFSSCLPDSQIAHLSENLYYLLQRVAPVYYSVPGGTPPTFNPLFLNAAQPTRVIQ